ncbi:hypothetical protein GGQ80_002515 [Sphingomonas jinjuensis]|uniref:DUF2946 domain-containing protein n=1 Tax=Sphingomonas jinjuensis TaxID=535907 RepID=A0A840FAC0_9SPHN|nr:hypothetical protein [Sphingomonas jinjuensis]MBB4154599.1 hypothetical protein [Sphingomonas jinjuensis]
MLARLIMVLVLALTALPHGASAAPAVAACHETMAPMHDSKPTPAPAAQHGCIGCIPPGDWLGVRVAGPVFIAALPPSPRVRMLAIGVGAPPALPPPRKA